MRNVRFIEQEAILQFACIPNHAIVPDNDLLTKVSVMADLAVPADNRRALDHCPVLNYGAFTDENPLANECDAFTVVFQFRTKVGFEVFL